MNLSTTYLGLKLKHPLVPSASPLSYTLEGMKRLEDAGASAIVMYSLFEEQIEAESKALDHYLSYGTDSFAEALHYFPEAESYNVGPDEYLNLLGEAKRALEIPIIASLNGATTGGWTRYAKLIEDVGADALELNIFYIPTDPDLPSSEVEKQYLEVVRDVREQVSIPLSVKVGPYFSNMAHMAKRLQLAGANGLVLFNRFYQPDFDVDNLEVTPHLVLSHPNELRLPLTWIAILYGRVPIDLALTSGVHSHLDVLKGLMAGANVTMMASELLRHGAVRIGRILTELTSWMEEHEYTSVKQMQGSMSQQHVANPDAFERANYMKVLQSYRHDPTGVLLPRWLK